MKHSKSVSVQVGTRTLKMETGTLACQAAGSVIVTVGETMVFSGVTNTDKPREGIDFFPLQVEYREKFYAAGRFPGGFFKREARPSEKEILIARVTTARSARSSPTATATTCRSTTCCSRRRREHDPTP
jgi:polyribonucleotide nucleotidyltransferase